MSRSASEIGKSIIAVLPSAAPNSVGKMFHWLIDQAINGNKVLPGAKKTAGHHLRKRRGDVEKAIDRLVNLHVSLAGTQGFVTSLGGAVASVVGMPAGMVAISIIQGRMVGAIAHLRGYDIESGQVQQAIMMSLLGEKIVNELVASGDLPGSPLVIATAPVLDDKLSESISRRVATSLLSQSGGKQMASMAGKRVPIVGGGIGLVTDSYNTLAISRYARAQFVSRRPALDD